METNLTEMRPSPTDPVDFEQTLGESSPSSPPTQALDDLSNSSSLPLELSLDNSSNIDIPPNDETLDTESHQGKEEGGDNDDNYNNAPASSSICSEEWQWHAETDLSKSFVGAGLANLGNTCFLNAILQCFTHTVALIQGLCSCNHTIPCNRDGFCVLCAFREHIELSLASTGRVVSPMKLVDNLRYISSSFCRYEQEDAHEFLQCFLDRLESCSIQSNTKDDNFVKQGFGGRLISRLRCCNCNHFSDTYEPSIDLSLEIDDADSLPTALESFTKIEKIEDPEAKFTCENCKEQVLVEKQLKLEELPKVAAFHLKRFKNDGSFVEKIDKHLDFPLDLDLRPYSSDSSNNDEECKYDLYAVVVHTGPSSTSGHYYCFIRSAPDTWYKFDDSKVIRVREAYVLSQEAYILFYAKQGTPWFSTFMETENEKSQSLCQNISNTSPKSVLENVDKIPTLSPNFVIKRSYVGNECMNTKDHSTTPVIKSLDRDSCKFDKIERRFSPQEINKKRAFTDSKNDDDDDMVPRTPPRSPSPDIYDDEPAELEVKVTKPRNHEKMVKKVSCKQEVNDDLELKLARKRCKIMGPRGAMLLASIDLSRSESSVNRKKTRSKLLSPRTVNRPLTAGSNS